MATDTPKYEQLYQMGRFVCGPPFQQFVDFFDTFDCRGCRVLDLGAAGRDETPCLSPEKGTACSA